jgi:energy-coupling factor transporter transmembrane protein EcfT
VAGLYLLAIRLITGILIGVPRPGNTLFTVPRVDLPSWLPGVRIGGAVTLERLSSSVQEGLIIASVIALFGAANSVTSPRKLLRTLPTSLYQVGVALTIATTVLPQLVSSISRIRSAQFLRNGKRVRISSIALPLLEESLNRAIHLAQSMESRGYGLTRIRTRYRPIPFRKVDSLYLSSGAALAFLAVFA